MRTIIKIFISILTIVILHSCQKNEGTDVQLSVNPTSAEFKNTGGTERITLTANVGWTVEVPKEAAIWCSVSPLSGIGNSTLTVTAEKNALTTPRSASVTIVYNGEKKTFSINQEAGTGEGVYADKEVRTYEINKQVNPVNMVFLGDGFIAEDFTDGGAFDKAVDEAVKAIFKVEPYKTYRNYFNIYKVGAISQQRGATYAFDNNHKRNTVFGTQYASENSSAMNTNNDKVFEYVKRVPGIKIEETSVILIVNDSRYGGTTTLYSTGQSIAICPMNRINQYPGGFGNITVHEAGGHGFGQLADEYTNGEPTPPTDEEINGASGMKVWFGFGFYSNVDLTNDLTQIKWKDFVGRQGYNAVGAYEGGLLHEKGVWRPEFLSCMDLNIPYFNAPSRKAIVKRIKTIAKEPFVLEEFIAKDPIKSCPPEYLTAVGYSRSGLAPALPRLAPPVLIKTE